MKLSPICLFTYNRIFETEQTIKALQKNYLAKQSELFIFSDGPKNDSDIPKISQVREFQKTINGFKSVEIVESRHNKGLANSVIEGVTQILGKYEKIIVIEDDLVTSPNFLNFMNQALEFYKNKDRIFSVSGYTLDLPSLRKTKKDYYLGYRASSWGWGTWKDRWKNVNWGINNLNPLIWNPVRHLKFLRGGSDLSLMLWRQKKGKIDSWAIRFCHHQFKNDLLTVFPAKSKLKSIGFGETASHTKKSNRFNVVLDNGEQKTFLFDTNPEINKKLAKEFRKKFSMITRLKDKLYK